MDTSLLFDENERKILSYVILGFKNELNIILALYSHLS